MSDRLRQNDLASHLIGVIDIRKGRAVHAIAGKRSQYQPARAEGITDGDALGLANRYGRWGVNSLYVADLDAICDNQPNTKLLAGLAGTSSHCIIDSGSHSAKVSRLLGDYTNTQFVLPTESFESIDQWSRACEQVGCERVIMGLDLVADQIRTRGSHDLHFEVDRQRTTAEVSRGLAQFEKHVSPWLETANALGVTWLLVLDLSFVGTSDGPGSAERCRHIRSQQKNLSLISGGGVRTYQDAMELRDAGCDRLLVGTALHQDASASKLFGLE